MMREKRSPRPGFLFWRSVCIGVCIAVTAISAAAQPSARIVGGSPVKPGAYPWVVALLASAVEDSTEAHFCGGTLIGPRHVLTAAHCVWQGEPVSPLDIEVLAGTTVLPFGRGNRTRVIGVTVHQLFNDYTLENDFAILKLAEPLPGPYVLPATGSELASVAGTGNGFILGWGYTSPAYPVLPTELQLAEVPVRGDGDCLADLGRWFKPLTMMCAGSKNTATTGSNGVDACFGDSGGPLLIEDNTGQLKIAGVVSWGLPGTGQYFCGEKFGVYAEVPSNITFVTSFPIAKPFLVKSPTVSGDPYVGATLRCDPGAWTGDPADSVTIDWVREEYPADGGEIKYVTVGTGSSLVVSDDLLGSGFFCRVTATNAGGTSVALSDYMYVEPPNYPELTPTPEFTPFPDAGIDSTAPIVTLLDLRCGKRSCTAFARATDEAGITDVALRIFRPAGGKCRIVGKRKKCASTERFVTAALLGDTLYRAEFPRGTRRARKAIVTAIAQDGSGNSSASDSIRLK